MKICIIAVGASGLGQIKRIQQKWQKGPWKDRLELSLFYIGSDRFSEEEWPAVWAGIQGKDIVFLDTMAAPKDFSQALYARMKDFPGQIVALNADRMDIRSLTRLGRFSMAVMFKRRDREGSPSLEKMSKMIGMMEKLGRALPVGPLRDMRNYLWLVKYWQLASEQNIENMLYLVGREYFDDKDLPAPRPPVTIDEITIMAPASMETYKSLEKFWKIHLRSDEKPTLAVLFDSNTYPVDTHPVVGQLVDRLGQAFNVIPIARKVVDCKWRGLKNILYPQGQRQIDLLINLLPFRLGQGPMGGAAEPAAKFLEELNVPVLHPFFLSKRTVDEWANDDQGVRTSEFLVNFFLPELDGCIEIYPIGAVSTSGTRFADLVLMDERVDRLTQRAHQWVSLRKKPNREKKIAIIFYDYPPGEGNVGSGAFIDTFASLEAILSKLSAEGYQVSPMTVEELRRAFIEEGRLNTPNWRGNHGRDQSIRVDAPTYRNLTQGWPAEEKLVERWGSFPGEIMSEKRQVILPGIVNGNMFIGVQPSRGVYEGAGSYHDKHLPPHHQYVAFYKWLEQEFQAHVCVHLGTHGTVEFLPGKEKAMSGDCYPDYLIGNMPHLYIYYAGNPSEAMIAKRRSHAAVVSHLPPPFVRGELYGEMQTIEALVAEYEEAAHLDPGRCPEILEDIQRQVEDLGWQWDGLDALSETLYEMQTALIPGRLHTFGRGFSEEETRGFLVQLFRDEGDKRPSLFDLFCQERGWAWNTTKESPHQYAAQIQELEDTAKAWVHAHVIEGKPVKSRDKRRLKNFQTLQKAGREIQEALRSNLELEALCKALNGEYLPAGLGGDLFRNPEILPTGRNIYQFDPRRVPSPSAMRRGEAIARNTLEQYAQAHGEYPRSVAVILWGLETTQTQGETVGQILAYLGARMSRTSLWEPELELIPLEELGRPRVDVIVQICGFFRDMFPNLIALLQDAFEMVGHLKDEEEGQNFVRQNARRLFQEMRSQGIKPEEAEELSLARIFGPATAEYGTSVTSLVKSREWQSEADLVANYLASLKHVYTKHHYGTEMEDLLVQNLRHVQVVSQVRHSRDYEITDLDHYYEFFGGLARTVEGASGRKAMMLVSDTHGGHVRTEDIQRSIQRGVRTRLLNPKWLDGMLAHDYHGGQQLADRLENLVGLSATTGAVDNCLFDEINDRLVLDEEMRNRIQQNNPYALMNVVERLLEAQARGYWQPEEEKLEELKLVYLQLEGDLEGESL